MLRSNFVKNYIMYNYPQKSYEQLKSAFAKLHKSEEPAFQKFGAELEAFWQKIDQNYPMMKQKVWCEAIRKEIEDITGTIKSFTMPRSDSSHKFRRIAEVHAQVAGVLYMLDERNMRDLLQIIPVI